MPLTCSLTQRKLLSEYFAEVYSVEGCDVTFPPPFLPGLSFSPLWITPLFYIATLPSPPSSPIPPQWPSFFYPGLFSLASAQQKAACTAQGWAEKKERREGKRKREEVNSQEEENWRADQGFSGTSPCCSCWVAQRTEVGTQKSFILLVGTTRSVCGQPLQRTLPSSI